jgi:hypothetical protein
MRNSFSSRARVFLGLFPPSHWMLYYIFTKSHSYGLFNSDDKGFLRNFILDHLHKNLYSVFVAFLADMIRIVFPAFFSLWQTNKSLLLALRPHMRNRSSSTSECSGSWKWIANSSKKTDIASSNEMPCSFLCAAALAVFYSKLTVKCMYNAIDVKWP